MNASPPSASPGLAPHLYGALQRTLAWILGLVAGFVGTAGLIAPGTIGQAVDTGQETTVASSHAAAEERLAAQERRVARLSRLNGCSRRGLDDRIPARAIVRDTGRQGAAAIRLTSFDEGWSMHQGQTPGELVAVCRR